MVQRLPSEVFVPPLPSFPIPVMPPVDEGSEPLAVCIPEVWLPYVYGALQQLIQATTWKGTEEEIKAAQSAAATMIANMASGACGTGGRAPYWDEPTGDDADGDDEATGFPWYEELSDWIVTAFLALSFTPDAAIEFVTTARKLRLWFRTRDYGAIVRILVDNIPIGELDTYSESPGMVEFAYDIPESMALSAQTSHTALLRLEHTGTANESATATLNGFAIEVIRKHIEWSTFDERDCPYGQTRYDEETDAIQIYDTNADAWVDAPYVDPRRQYQYPPVATSNPRCDAAARMSAEMRANIEGLMAGIDSALTASALAQALITAWGFAFGVTILLPVAFRIATRAVGLGSIALHAAFDSFDWDELTCTLYCLIDEEGRISEAKMPALYEYIASLTITQNTMLSLVALGMSYGLLSGAAATREEVGDCDECNECNWCYHFDFLTGEHGWLPRGGGETQVAGQGWKGYFFLTNQWTNSIRRVFTGNVRKITMEAYGNAVSGGGARGIWVNGTKVATGVTAAGEQTTVWTGNINATEVFCNWDISANGSALTYIRSIEIEGEGANPFGEDNCI